MMIVLIFVLPRLQSSLHPGNGGNPGLMPMTWIIECAWCFILPVWDGSLSVIGYIPSALESEL
jgi:hypothetical protein